jgi:hypothetical protein
VGFSRRRRPAAAPALPAQLAPPGDPRVFAETGQLVAVIGDAGRPDNSDEIAISRPDVSYSAIETALDGWEDWAMVQDANTYCWISLAQIQRRVNESGPGSECAVMQQDRLFRSADGCSLSRCSTGLLVSRLVSNG